MSKAKTKNSKAPATAEGAAPETPATVVAETLEFNHPIANMIRAMRSEDAGISLPQLGTLAFLREHNGVPARTIVNSVGLSGSNATLLLDGLETKGFVTRTAPARGEGDRRVKRVEITEAGLKLLQDFNL